LTAQDKLSHDPSDRPAHETVGSRETTDHLEIAAIEAHFRRRAKVRVRTSRPASAEAPVVFHRGVVKSGDCELSLYLDQIPPEVLHELRPGMDKSRHPVERFARAVVASFHSSDKHGAMSDPFPRNRDGGLCPPSPKELGLHPEILEVAEEIASSSDVPELEQSVLERLVCAVVLADRHFRACRPL